MKNLKMKKYTNLSEKNLHDAEILIRKGNLSQASENLRGAMVTIVRALEIYR